MIPFLTKKGRCFWLLLIWIGVMSAIPPDASGQVPRLINYQGSLLEGEFPASGALSIAFALYPSAQGGEALWTETHSVTPREGHFSVLLGSRTAFPGELFAGESTLFLQVTVEGEALPRLRLTSTVFALRAGTAEKVAPGAVDRDALADGAVNGAKLANGAVDTPQLADGSVMTAKLQAEAVTSAKIANGAVQQSDIENGAVTRSKIAENAVTNAQLARGAVTEANIVNGEVTSSDIQNGTIASTDIDNDAVVKSISAPDGSDGTVILRDDVALQAGDNIEIEVNDQTITISSEEGGIFGAGQPSSRRWKTSIEPLRNALATVRRLQGVSFEWKDTGRSDIGLIAEAVGEVVPEVVAYEDGQAQAVNYGHLVGLLIEAVKQQQAQIEVGRQEIGRLKIRLEHLERRVQHQTAASQAPGSEH